MMYPLLFSSLLLAGPQAMSLSKDQAAPYAGILMDSATALRLTQMADGCTAKSLLDQKKCDADAAIEKRRSDGLIAALQKRPKELEDCSHALSDCDQSLIRQQGIGGNRFIWALIGMSAGVVSGSVFTAYLLNH